RTRGSRSRTAMSCRRPTSTASTTTATSGSTRCTSTTSGRSRSPTQYARAGTARRRSRRSTTSSTTSETVVSVAIPSSITVEEYQQRVDACRRIADEHGLDALIAWSDSRRPGHVLYLTGHIPFNGTAMVVITAETCVLVVDADWDL